MTEYKKVFTRFLSKIDSTEYANMSPSLLTLSLIEIMEAAIDYMQADGVLISSDLTKRKNEILCFTVDLASDEIEILALYMVGVWYDPIINSLEHTSMFFGSEDEKWNNQTDHLNAVSNIQENYFQKARNLVQNKYAKETSGKKSDEGEVK